MCGVNDYLVLCVVVLKMASSLRLQKFLKLQRNGKLFVITTTTTIITSGVLEHKWRASLKLHYC